jgi:hypothetical protein
MSTLCTSKSRTFLLTLLFTWWATECPGDYKYYTAYVITMEVQMAPVTLLVENHVNETGS